MALFPFQIPGYDWLSSEIPILGHPSAILVLGAVLMYFGALERLPSNEGNMALLAWLDEPLAALQTIDKLVGAYFPIRIY